MEMKYYSDPYTPSGPGTWIRLEEYMMYMNTTSAEEDFKDCPPVRISERCGTIYLVEYDTSDNAKETAYEKIRRLLLNDVDALRTSSSC